MHIEKRMRASCIDDVSSTPRQALRARNWPRRRARRSRQTRQTVEPLTIKREPNGGDVRLAVSRYGGYACKLLGFQISDFFFGKHVASSSRRIPPTYVFFTTKSNGSVALGSPPIAAHANKNRTGARRGEGFMTDRGNDRPAGVDLCM